MDADASDSRKTVQLIADSFLYSDCFCLVFFALVVIYCLVVEAGKRRFTPASGKLYASARSTCSRKVIMALAETGADYLFQHIDLGKLEQKKPDYLKIQPYGKVPVWEEENGKFRIYESRAILKHVTAGSPIYPIDDTRFIASIEMWMSIEYSYFQDAWKPIFVEKILKKRKDPKHVPNESLCKEKAQELLKTLDQMEEQLKLTKGYIAGDRFSIADITFIPYFQLFKPAGLEGALDSRPYLKKWRERVSERKSWDYVNKEQVLTRRSSI